MLVTKQLTVATDFHSIFFFFTYYRSQWLPSTVERGTHTGFEQTEGE